MPDGTIQPEFVNTLSEIGVWMKKNGATIYGTRGGVLKPQEWGVVTAKDKIWYAHIIKKPKQESYIFIPDVKNKIKKCHVFNTKTELKFKQQPEGVFVYLGNTQIDAVDTILEIHF